MRKKESWRRYRDEVKGLDHEEVEEMKRLLILAVPERKKKLKEVEEKDEKETDKEDKEEKERVDTNCTIESKVENVDAEIENENNDKEKVKVIGDNEDKIEVNAEDKMLESYIKKEVIKEDMVNVVNDVERDKVVELEFGPLSPKSDILNPLALDLGEILAPRPTQVGCMGYPDQHADRFGGALNQVDIAGQTDGQYRDNNSKLLRHENLEKVDLVVNELRPKDVIQCPLLRLLDYIMKDDITMNSRSAKFGQIGPKISFLRKKFENLNDDSEKKICQNLNLKNSDGKAGLRSVLDEQKIVHAPPRSPLLRYMQSNEKKWAEGFKRKKEESSLKKKRKKEKEAKLEAENIKRKGLQKIQVLYDKMMSPKGSGKSDTTNCPKNKKITLEDGKNVSLVSKPDSLVPTSDQGEVNSMSTKIESLKQDRKGRLHSDKNLTNFGSKSIVFDSTQGLEVKKGHTLSNQERAMNFKEKLAIFEEKSDRNGAEK